MACLIDAWRHIHPSLPPLHSGDKKNSPVLLSEQFVAGDEQHRLSLHGGHPHSPQHRLFLPLCSACLPRSWFCACHPPSHRTALCSSGGRGACAATSVLPLPFRSPLSCGGAFWQGDKVIQFIDRKFPSSGIIRRC